MWRLLFETPGPGHFHIGFPNNWPAPIAREQEDPRQPPSYSTYLDRGPVVISLSGDVEGTLVGCVLLMSLMPTTFLAPSA
jgi:hypothetical protein